MTICRYYQQGACTYGSSCRFEHSITSRPSGNIFGGGGGQDNNNIISTLVTTVKQDVEQSTKGNQWVFSCYSPAKARWAQITKKFHYTIFILDIESHQKF